MVLNLSHQFVESDLFSYQGVIFNPPRIEFVLFAYVLSLAPALWLPLKLQQTSDLAQWVMYITLLVPCVFFPFHVSERPPEEVLTMVTMFFLSYVLFSWMLLRLEPIRLKPIRFSHEAFSWFLLVAIFLCTVMVGAQNGFQLKLSMDDVYQRRLEARDAVAGGSLAGYALAWLAGSFAPIGIVYGLVRRHFFLVAAGVVGLVSIFSFSGTKSSLFTPLVMLLLFWIVRSGKQTYSRLMLVGTIALISISALLWTKIENPILSESFTRRLLISKGVSTAFYWQEFQDDPMFMRDSMFARLVGMQDELPKTFRIGIKYGKGDAENYNANAWASAQANFGYTGFFLCSIVAALVLKIMDGFAKYGNFDVLSVASAFFAIVWGEQAMESSFLSSGVIVTLGLMFLLSGTALTVRKANPALPGEIQPA
ncbi:MAG: hypothetical protein JST40_00545 [Armatimonadetes bacterium]|nr:hypothetical protein [Armatimonadota bacterium]